MVLDNGAKSIRLNTCYYTRLHIFLPLFLSFFPISPFPFVESTKRARPLCLMCVQPCSFAIWINNARSQVKMSECQFLTGKLVQPNKRYTIRLRNALICAKMVGGRARAHFAIFIASFIYIKFKTKISGELCMKPSGPGDGLCDWRVGHLNKGAFCWRQDSSRFTAHRALRPFILFFPLVLQSFPQNYSLYSS